MPNITTNHASTYTNRQFHYLFKLWKLMCLLTSASKVSRARERKTVTGNCTINIISSSNQHHYMVEIAYQNEEKQLGATGCTSSPAWNLWKPFTFAPVRRTLWWILHFKIWTMIFCSLYAERTKIRLGTVYVQQGNNDLCKLSGTFNVQQTIYSVCVFSCLICCPLIRYVCLKKEPPIISYKKENP